MTSQMADYVDQSTIFHNTQKAAIVEIKIDAKELSDQLANIQNSAGTLSTADQTSLDRAIALVPTITRKLTALNALPAPIVSPDVA